MARKLGDVCMPNLASHRLKAVGVAMVDSLLDEHWQPEKAQGKRMQMPVLESQVWVAGDFALNAVCDNRVNLMPV